MISVCILTKNAKETLASTLESVSSFPEIVILDNGSTDETFSIARQFANVKIYESPFIGFGPLRNQAAKLSSHDWILALDSDEVVSPALLKEISSLKLSEEKIYSLPRHNYYRSKRIKGCGWSPDRVIRLYHRKKAQFSSAAVHESLLANQLSITPLSSPLLHTPYRSISDFLSKMQHYSTLFAQQNQFKKPSSFTKAWRHALFAFFRSYILKRGFLDGKEGFEISFYNATTTFYKYLKLAELNKK